LLFWGVLIWLVVTLINAAQSGKKEEDPSNILKKRYASGEISKKQYNILKKRYASGEISKKQYEEMKKELK